MWIHGQSPRVTRGCYFSLAKENKRSSGALKIQEDESQLFRRGGTGGDSPPPRNVWKIQL